MKCLFYVYTGNFFLSFYFLSFYLLSVNKILKLKVFEEDGKRWKKSVMDLNYEVLCVSQVIKV